MLCETLFCTFLLIFFIGGIGELFEALPNWAGYTLVIITGIVWVISLFH